MNPCSSHNPETVASRFQLVCGRMKLLILVASITLVCLAPKTMATRIWVACYGTNYSGAPWNGRSVMVACSEDCAVLNSPTCYEVTYSPPNPIPRYCLTLGTETGMYCFSTTNIITYSGQQGTAQCILKNSSTNAQYTSQYTLDAPGTNLCQSLGQCIDWRPVTNTNVELPSVRTDTYPDTNSVCRDPPPPGG